MLKTVLSSHFQRRWSSDQEEKQDTQCPRFHLRHVFIDAIPRGTVSCLLPLSWYCYGTARREWCSMKYSSKS